VGGSVTWSDRLQQQEPTLIEKKRDEDNDGVEGEIVQR